MDLEQRCRDVLETAWRAEPGYCVPNSETYPHQWLWDSCFHSVVWSALGDTRAVEEVRSCLANQHPSGFVPHMTYWSDPSAGFDYWGRTLTSVITQPPMYGHALAVAHRSGLSVSEELVAQAVRGLNHLLGDRRRRGGLICALHPWETGCDDSARWDDFCQPYSRERWRAEKTRLLRTLTLDASGTPVGSAFEIPSVGFNALVAWNARELTEEFGVLVAGVDELVDAISARWNEDLRTWTDDDSGSGTARTLDALLAALVDPREEVFEDLVHPDRYGAPFGPRGAHRDEQTFDPNTYWRGPNWPQLTYLLSLASRAAGHSAVADALTASLRAAAIGTDFSEYWNPDTGTGGGACPQTWTTLAML